MAIDATDWTVTRSTGAIRYIGDDHGGASPTYATVIELRRWLGSLADDESPADPSDELAIYDEDPADRLGTDNIIRLKGIYNIDDNAAEHLYDGSIIQGTGGTEVIYDGFVNFGNATNIQIIQNGAVLADDWWNANGGLNPDATRGISHRFMLKVRDAGADIDGRRIVATSRVFGKTYSEFGVNGTSRGNNTLALSQATDLNNPTLEATVAGWTGISNTTEGYALIDVNNDGTPEAYYSEWNTDQPTRSINDFYERMKWLTRDGSASTLYGLNGELFRGITHELDLTTPRSGTFAAFEAVSWAGGTGQMFAIDSPTAGTKMWIQVLTGTAPGSGVTITGASTATATTTGTATSHTISTPFIGASTGSALIGAYGVGIEYLDLKAADKVTALDGLQKSPPNNQTFAVSGLVVGEDRVLVAPWDGSTLDNEGFPAIDTDQLTLQTSLLGATETAVVVTAAIPTDTPASGTIRVQLDDGNYWYQTYTSWTGSTFTIPSTDYSVATGNGGATNPKNVYISYIDKLAASTTETFTAQYIGDRSLVVIVRDGGGTPIKQSISQATFNSGGGGTVVTRTSDL